MSRFADWLIIATVQAIVASKPGAVRVTLNMGEQWAELVRDAYGRLTFEGIDYDEAVE